LGRLPACPRLPNEGRREGSLVKSAAAWATSSVLRPRAFAFRASRPAPEASRTERQRESGWPAESAVRAAPRGRLDVRTIADQTPRAVTGLAVASYLAKYATKGTEVSGHASARISADTLNLYADPAGTHTDRLIDACWYIGHADGRMCGKATYRSLRRWVHMLGFGGHFLTKARRYSVTLTALRQARITYRRHQDTGPDHTPFHRQDNLDTEPAIVIVRLSYAGTGWRTFGDALLANTAADQARKRREAGREELTHECAENVTERKAA
jgi:hypothetical protein